MGHESESGFSLLECIVALGIASLLLVGVISGFVTTTAVTTKSGDRATAEATLESVTEHLSGLAYRPCMTVGQATAAVATIPVPDGFQAGITSVRYLASGSSSFVAACTPSADRGAQLVGVSVRAPGGFVTRGEMVVRNPEAMP